MSHPSSPSTRLSARPVSALVLLFLLLSIALSSAGCSKTSDAGISDAGVSDAGVSDAGTATSDSAGATSIPANPGPGDVALLYVDAFRGRPEALLSYDPDAEITTAVNLPVVFNEGFLQNGGEMPSGDEVAKLNELGINTLAKAEVEISSEQVEGDLGTVVVEIRGLDFEAAVSDAESRIIPEDFDSETEFFTALLTESWQVAGLGEKASAIEMILIRSQDTDSPDKWMLTVADTSSTEIYEIFEALMYS